MIWQSKIELELNWPLPGKMGGNDTPDIGSKQRQKEFRTCWGSKWLDHGVESFYPMQDHDYNNRVNLSPSLPSRVPVYAC